MVGHVQYQQRHPKGGLLLSLHWNINSETSPPDSALTQHARGQGSVLLMEEQVQAQSGLCSTFFDRCFEELPKNRTCQFQGSRYVTAIEVTPELEDGLISV